MPYSYHRLRNYGKRYYCRYFPSAKRLLEKLTQKSDDPILSEKVLKELDFLIDDRKTIENNIRILLIRHKNTRFMITHLMKKWFLKEDIIHILSTKFESESQTLLDPISTKRKIENLQKKGKSKKYIFAKLSESQFDQELLESIWNELGIPDESETIRKCIQKYQSKLNSKQKLTQKLLSDWFSYRDIKRYFEDSGT